MSKETGGQAFPISGSENNMPVQGMTLRDHFAGQAMQGDWASQDEETGVFGNNDSEDELCERAKAYYRMADAMLKARGE